MNKSYLANLGLPCTVIKNIKSADCNMLLRNNGKIMLTLCHQIGRPLFSIGLPKPQVKADSLNKKCLNKNVTFSLFFPGFITII